MCKKPAMMAMVMVFLGLIGPAAMGQGDPNLMGWWKFDGDALDASGNGRNGTLVGDAAFSPGLLGQALVLDGTGDYVNIVGYKGILGANAFSVALWVNTTGSGTMINWGAQAAAQRVDFRVDQGRLRMEHGNGNVQGKTVLNDGQWHHVALTVVAGATMTYPNVTVYVDGVDDSQPMIAGPTFNLVANADFTIGRRQTNSDRAFLGWLDDVRLYDRVLTATEIQALAMRPRAYKPNPADKAEGVTMPMLTWTPRQTAFWHDVYLGTSPVLGPADLVGSHLRTTVYFHVPGLTPGTTYYWKVDETDPDGTVYPGDVWSFTFASLQTWKPVPADGEPYADPNLTLTWEPGLNAGYHDVYIGTDKAAVTDGTAETFKGRQDLTTYATGLLPPKTTYYWRVDEVNEAGGKIKGPVWTFTTLPAIAIADPNLVGWWRFDEGSGTRAVDWSGHGHHGTLNGTPTWTDGYDGRALAFDGARSGDYIEVRDYPGVLGKHDRTVAAWIQTITTGDIMAWGMATNTQKWTLRVQDENGNRGTIRVECQGGRIVGWTDLRDGEWHHVAAVLQSAGEPTILDVRLYVDGVQEAISDSLLMAIDTVGGDRNVLIGDSYQSRPVTGLLDDVRIYDRALTQAELDAVMRIDPQRAWRPYPATGSIVDIRTATPLTWSAGGGATKHDVFLGTDAPAVTDANSADTTGIYLGQTNVTSLTPAGDLQWGQKYFWRVDEIKADGAVTQGKVWSFTVADYLIIDTFESYTNGSPNRVFQTWIDGVGFSPDEFFPKGNSGNGSNAAVGYDIWNVDGPHYNGSIMERANVYSGSQAMPIDYNNTVAKYYSEAERTWTSPQDWTFNDVNTLVVHFRGDPGNSPDSLYIAIQDSSNHTAVVTHADPNAVLLNTWQQWTIDLAAVKSAQVNLKAIKKMSIGVGDRNNPLPDGTGRLYIDDIRLTKGVPVDPNAAP